MIIEINRKHLCKNVKQTFISTWIVMPVKKNCFIKALDISETLITIKYLYQNISLQ